MRLLLIAAAIFSAAQSCLGEPTDATMEAVVQECLTKEHIPAEDLNSLWEGGFDDGATNDVMSFAKCLLELFGITNDGLLNDDFIAKCLEHEAPQKCVDIQKSCSADDESDALVKAFKIFVCLRNELM